MLLCVGSKPKCKLCGARNPVFAQCFSSGGGGGTSAHKIRSTRRRPSPNGQRSPHYNLRPTPDRPLPPGASNTATAAATAQLTSSTHLPRLQQLRKELESAQDPAVKERVDEKKMTVRESFARSPFLHPSMAFQSLKYFLKKDNADPFSVIIPEMQLEGKTPDGIAPVHQGPEAVDS